MLRGSIVQCRKIGTRNLHVATAITLDVWIYSRCTSQGVLKFSFFRLSVEGQHDSWMRLVKKN